MRTTKKTFIDLSREFHFVDKKNIERIYKYDKCLFICENGNCYGYCPKKKITQKHSIIDRLMR